VVRSSAASDVYKRQPLNSYVLRIEERRLALK
jgi:hypothetical protein